MSLESGRLLEFEQQVAEYGEAFRAEPSGAEASLADRYTLARVVLARVCDRFDLFVGGLRLKWCVKPNLIVRIRDTVSYVTTMEGKHRGDGTSCVWPAAVLPEQSGAPCSC
jgi:hypothetical protein